MLQKYTNLLLKKARETKCDICDKKFTSDEVESLKFHYSKTKRRNEVYVHKSCWEDLYRRK